MLGGLGLKKIFKKKTQRGEIVCPPFYKLVGFFGIPFSPPRSCVPPPTNGVSLVVANILVFLTSNDSVESSCVIAFLFSFLLVCFFPGNR